MKNHFYMGYAGNKRNEIPFIYDYLNFDNITTIIEPYAGTCSISYYISTKKSGLKYILNDNNKYLLEMFYLLKDDNKIKQFEEEFKEKCEYFKNDKNKYLEIIKENTLMGWFIKNKIYAIRPGLYPINNNKTYKETLDLKSFSIYDFFNNNDITFLNIDGLKCFEDYKNNENCLILMDPPYLNACNDFYQDSKINIYEYLFNNNIKNDKAKIYLILENMWVISLLFKDMSIIEYDKKYCNQNKKKTTHILISNLLKN